MLATCDTAIQIQVQGRSISSPGSLDLQLVKILETAHRLKIFIPWEYIYCDSAVPGTVAQRWGYLAIKALIKRVSSPISTLFVDEVGRASRDAIEALMLGQLISSCEKRMVDSSDSFDTEQPMSKMMLQISAMVHEHFVDQLRAKVKRGQRDAFERGRNIRTTPIGYKLVPQLDAHGKPVLNEEGRV